MLDELESPRHHLHVHDSFWICHRNQHFPRCHVLHFPSTGQSSDEPDHRRQTYGGMHFPSCLSRERQHGFGVVVGVGLVHFASECVLELRFCFRCWTSRFLVVDFHVDVECFLQTFNELSKKVLFFLEKGSKGHRS